jgi:hypothetical protein
MKSVILLRRRRVLWGSAIAVCLVSGFILMMSKIPVPRVAQHSSPAAFRAGSAAQPRLVESYGKLPLSFEINRGQTESRVKFLARGRGYSLFLTGNEAVLALRKPIQMANGKRQMAQGVAQRLPRPRWDWGVVSRPAWGGQRTAELFPALVLPPFRTVPPLGDATDNEPRTTDAVLHMKLVGANPDAKVSGLDQLPGKSNYFIGNDPKKWRANVPNYAKVKYADVYPGVDLVYYGNQRKLEYDFVVSPGADPGRITLELETGQSKIDKHGDLVVPTDGGEVVFHKPVVYQPATYNVPRTTNQELIDGRYMLAGNRVTFEVANYDKTRPLVIDPVLAYSTFLGGSGVVPAGAAGGDDMAVDSSGNAYVIGYAGADFPTTPGAFQTTYGGNGDAVVSKLNAAGTALLYSTYLGGSGQDSGSGIAVDATGNAYVTGWTGSSDFPTTPGAFQATPPLGTGTPL